MPADVAYRAIRLRIISLLMREKIYPSALLAALGRFHAATVRQGHLWADDFAMYVHHAQNIVAARPYTDTGYIFNPSLVVGPKSIRRFSHCCSHPFTECLDSI